MFQYTLEIDLYSSQNTLYFQKFWGIKFIFMKHDFLLIGYKSKYSSHISRDANDKCLIMKTKTILTTYLKNDSQKTLTVKTIESYFLGFGHGRFTSGIWLIIH